MPITVNSLYRDTFNFLRNNAASILSLTLLSALITIIFNQIFSPDNAQLEILNAAETNFSQANLSIREIVQQMTHEQQVVLLKVSLTATLSSLAGNVFLTATMLMLVSLTSQGRPASALQAVSNAIPVLPGLLVLMLIITLLTQLGLTLFIIPGIMIAVILSLAPVILINGKTGVIAAIKASAALAFAHMRLIIPVIILWLTAKLFLLFLVKYLTALTPIIIALTLSIINNIISALLLVYLFRLYMLLHKQ